MIIIHEHQSCYMIMLLLDITLSGYCPGLSTIQHRSSIAILIACCTMKVTCAHSSVPVHYVEVLVDRVGAVWLTVTDPAKSGI